MKSVIFGVKRAVFLHFRTRVYNTLTYSTRVNTHPLTKSARDLTVKAQVLPHQAGEYALKVNNI